MKVKGRFCYAFDANSPLPQGALKVEVGIVAAGEGFMSRMHSTNVK
jgi:hypothetical protein